MPSAGSSAKNAEQPADAPDICYGWQALLRSRRVIRSPLGSKLSHQMQREPDWRQYERKVHTELTSNYPDALIRHDVRLPGFLSATTRQVDILVEEDLPGGRVATAIDAKQHARRIYVKEVEAFVGLLHDIRVDRGIKIGSNLLLAQF